MAGFSDFLSEIVMMTFFIFLAKPGFKCKYLHFFYLFFQLIYNFNLVLGLLPSIQTTCLGL